MHTPIASACPPDSVAAVDPNGGSSLHAVIAIYTSNGTAPVVVTPPGTTPPTGTPPTGGPVAVEAAVVAVEAVAAAVVAATAARPGSRADHPSVADNEREQPRPIHRAGLLCHRPS